MFAKDNFSALVRWRRCRWWGSTDEYPDGGQGVVYALTRNFERPSNPPGYETDEVLVLHDNATLALGVAHFEMNVFAQ